MEHLNLEDIFKIINKKATPEEIKFYNDHLLKCSECTNLLLNLSKIEFFYKNFSKFNLKSIFILGKSFSKFLNTKFNILNINFFEPVYSFKNYFTDKQKFKIFEFETELFLIKIKILKKIIFELKAKNKIQYSIKLINQNYDNKKLLIKKELNINEFSFIELPCSNFELEINKESFIILIQ